MTGTIHIVDDEETIRDALAFLFASRGMTAIGWPSGEAFLEAQPLDDCACIILDVRMRGLSGPEVFERLRAMGSDAPVIFLTGHADVPVAVSTLKAGAFDFVEKPFNDNQIVDLAREATARFVKRRVETREADSIARKIRSLSAREAEVMERMIDGKLNKQIAGELGIAIRTVEVHRGRVLAKIGAGNAADLARLVSPLLPVLGARRQETGEA